MTSLDWSGGSTEVDGGQNGGFSEPEDVENTRLASFLQIYGLLSSPVNIFGVIIIMRGSTPAMAGYKWNLLTFQVGSWLGDLTWTKRHKLIDNILFSDNSYKSSLNTKSLIYLQLAINVLNFQISFFL